MGALEEVLISHGDVLTLADTGATLAALSAGEVAALMAQDIDTIDATDNTLTLSLAQVQALSGATFAGADLVTVVASAADFAALTAQDFADLAAAGVDAFATTDHALSLTVAQIQALDGIVLASGDTITLADSSATIAALSAATLAGLVAQGVDRISFTDQTGELDAAQALALEGATIASDSTLTVLDTAASLQALSPAQWAAVATGAHTFATPSHVLTLDTAQALAIGDMVPVNGNTLVIEDTGAAISALTATQLAAFAGKGAVTPCPGRRPSLYQGTDRRQLRHTVRGRQRRHPGRQRQRAQCPDADPDRRPADLSLHGRGRHARDAGVDLEPVRCWATPRSRRPAMPR
jgi:hypothetical protein